MKKLIMILTVVLFANQVSALDFDEWVGFECFRYDFYKDKLITNITDQKFFAVKKDNSEIYWQSRGFNNLRFNRCENVDFRLVCGNGQGEEISVHRFTNRITFNNLPDMDKFRIYKCDLVEQKF